MAILSEAAFVIPTFAAWTKMHGIECIWVIRLLAETCAGINDEGLKHNVRDRMKTNEYSNTYGYGPFM